MTVYWIACAGGEVPMEGVSPERKAEARANAYLKAAAPSLLAVCERLVACVEMFEPSPGVRDIAEEARNAIAEATPPQP